MVSDGLCSPRSVTAVRRVSKCCRPRGVKTECRQGDGGEVVSECGRRELLRTCSDGVGISLDGFSEMDNQTFTAIPSHVRV
jgi:hypothetical protein